MNKLNTIKTIIMKTTMLFIINFLLLNLCYGQAFWQPIEMPNTENYQSVYFIDSSNGWIISSEGSIIKTQDGGSSWDICYSNPDYVLKSVFFTDINHGIVVGYGTETYDFSVILSTTDAGNTWILANHEQVLRLNDVFFIDGNIGWTVGCREEYNANCCLYTDDGGLSWELQSSILVSAAELFGVSFRDANNGQLCGANGAFFTSNSGGTSGWALGISLPVVNLNGIYNFGALNGCIVCDDGTALFTTNNWYQYIEQNSNTTENLNAVHGAPGTAKLWAAGDQGIIIHSSNYLLDWQLQISNTIENLHDIIMLSETDGWAVGNNGTVLHYSSNQSLCASPVQAMKIFPNPATDHLIIEFGEDVNNFSFSIYNLSGINILKGTEPHNSSEISINISSFSPGIYLINFHTEKGNYWDRIQIQ